MREHGPEWKYVILIEEKEKENPTVRCCFCEKVFVGGPARIRQHLSGEKNTIIKPCEKVPESVVEEIQKLVNVKCDSKLLKRKLEALDKATRLTTSKVSASTGAQQTIPTMFNNKKAVDESVARAFYSSGIPFAVANNYHFKKALADISKFGPGYTPPSEFTLRTSLLQGEVKAVGTEIRSKILHDLHLTGSTLVSDGWSNVRNKPLINYILVCTKGEVFLDSTDTSGQDKSSEFIATEIIKQIAAVGPANVIQVVTDSASNCKGSWRFISDSFPHITCGPCTAHCLEVLLEDIAKVEWIKDNFKQGREIVRFVTAHHRSLAIFRSHSGLELLKPNDTRFCTEFISQTRLVLVKDSLQETVVDKKFKSWIEKQRYKQTGIDISARILDEGWWQCVGTVIKMCDPIVNLLRLMDGRGLKPAIGKIYFRMFDIVQHIDNMADLSAEDRDVIKSFVNNRWKMLHTDMHSAGFILDPEYNFEAYAQGKLYSLPISNFSKFFLNFLTVKQSTGYKMQFLLKSYFNLFHYFVSLLLLTCLELL